MVSTRWVWCRFAFTPPRSSEMVRGREHSKIKFTRRVVSEHEDLGLASFGGEFFDRPPDLIVAPS